jgi:hypothetical protein
VIGTTLAWLVAASVAIELRDVVGLVVSECERQCSHSCANRASGWAEGT